MGNSERLTIGISLFVIVLSIIIGKVLDLYNLTTILVASGIFLTLALGNVAIIWGYGRSIHEANLKNAIDQLKAALPSAKYDWLYTANDINVVETQATGKDIWVISPDLSNDTSPSAASIIDAVKRNIRRKITYTYIVPDTETIKAVIPRLSRIFTSHEDQLHIIKTSPDKFKILSIAHIVVYNPNMDGGQNPEVFLEIPIEERGHGKGYWVKVADDAALDLVGRFRKIVEEKTL